jgi:hypothetical protein
LMTSLEVSFKVKLGLNVSSDGETFTIEDTQDQLDCNQ